MGARTEEELLAKKQNRKIYIALAVAALVIAAFVGSIAYKDYRSYNYNWSLNVPEGTDFARELRADYDYISEVSFEYQGYSHDPRNSLLTVSLTADEWQEADLQAIVDRCCELAQDEGFLGSYAVAYHDRYGLAMGEGPDLYVDFLSPDSGGIKLEAAAFRGTAPYTDMLRLTVAKDVSPSA